ncbi:hypothetical protein Tco_1201252 [Tanacetum coccineum]
MINTVMLDSDESGVTHTEISSPFEDLSDIGSPGVTTYLAPREPQSPPLPDFVPEPVYPECPEHADDEIVAEDQPYAEDASPTAQSPDYVPESDPEADPEEDEDEDPEEDTVDYPADGGDDGDDKDGSSEDDEDDDMDIEADDDEEEVEHLAPADYVVVALLATDLAPSAEETEPFETVESAATPPPHPVYRVTARISIPAPVPTPVWSDAEIPSPSLPLSPPSPVLSPAPPPSPIRSLGYRAAMIRMRAEAASTSHSLPLPPPFILSPTRPDAPSLGIPPPLPISVPTSSPPLLLPSASRREDRPEVTLPPRKRLGIALGPGYESDDVRYGITDSWDEIVETLQGAPISTDTELGRHMTVFETRVRQDTDEVYTRLDDEQGQRQLLAGRLNMLFRDRRAHAHTRFLMETEAKMSREAWVGSMGASDLARAKTVISELLAADYRRQRQLIEALKLVKSLQTRWQTRTGVDNHNSGTGAWRNERATHECTYPDFMKCQPLNFKGTEGVIELTQWVLLAMDIAYCNVHGLNKEEITDKYYPRTEIKKLEVELWELKVKGTDVIGYNQHFQELALLCGRMFLGESDKIKKYVDGLPDMIHGSVVASKPKDNARGN